MRSVIFDTDIGIDDAMALLFLNAAEAISIKAITTRFGNASIENTTRNALAVSEMFDINVPVYRGAAEPLSTRLGKGYPKHVHGNNGLGDIQLPVPRKQAESESAAESLVKLSLQAEEKISIIAVGGLTNIAAALAIDPDFAHRIEQLVVMGGAFGYQGHRGNVSPVAEANIASDPKAADIVFTSAIPTAIVGLDVTHEVLMDQQFIRELTENAGAAGEFIADCLQHYLNFYQSISGKPQCPLHDSSAVAYLLRPELFTTISHPVRVVTEGIAIGQTIHSNDDRKYVSEAWDNIPDSTLCTDVDAAAVLQFYLSTLRNFKGFKG
jgi:purine nucleosidase